MMRPLSYFNLIVLIFLVTASGCTSIKLMPTNAEISIQDCETLFNNAQKNPRYVIPRGYCYGYLSRLNDGSGERELVRPLHLAVVKNDIALTYRMLKNGHSPSLKEHGYTAIDLVYSGHGNEEIRSLLSQYLMKVKVQ